MKLDCMHSRLKDKRETLMIAETFVFIYEQFW